MSNSRMRPVLMRHISRDGAIGRDWLYGRKDGHEARGGSEHHIPGDEVEGKQLWSHFS
jgi:hypothetical protein